MDKIIELSQTEVQQLLSAISSRKSPKAHTLRVCIDGDNVKFKVNEYTWSPPMGHLDPMCRNALQHDLEALKPENRVVRALTNEDHQAMIDAEHEM